MKEFNLTKSKLFFYLGSCVVVIAVIITISVSLISRFVFGRNLQSIRNEKALLHERIIELRDQTNTIQSKIDQLNESDDDLRLITGMPRLDKDIKEVGVGGTPTNINNFGGFFNEEGFLAEDISDKLEEFERRITLLRGSFTDIEKGFSELEEFRRYYPSIRPVVGGKTTDRFGPRIHPIHKTADNHPGIDISIEKGTPIRATADGVVTFRGDKSGYGNYIMINHNKAKYGFETAYGHLSEFLVKEGQRVKRGDIIGKVGSTGTSTAAHLHYEVLYNGTRVDPISYYYDPKILR